MPRSYPYPYRPVLRLRLSCTFRKAHFGVLEIFDGDGFDESR